MKISPSVWPILGDEDYTCAWFAFGGPISPRIGFQWVFRQAPRHRSWPRLNRDPDGVDRQAAAPYGLVKAGVLENHTSRDLSGHDSFCVASKQTKSKVLVKTERKKSAFFDLCMQRPWPPVVHCQSSSMQVNRCQGGQSSRLCRRTGSFPVVTVTNYSPNRSTLNDCNFVVSWRIELKFVALESWRVRFFLYSKFRCKTLRFEKSSAVPTVGVSFRLIINQFIWIWLFLTSFRAEVCEEQEWRVGLTYVPTTACIRCGASSRKRHGNRHAKPAGLRVPVRPNLRKFLVKCSTSGSFFVNFYTLFFSTTSSVLLRKV